MKRLIVLIPLLFCLFAKAQYCGPYTAHANISESNQSFQTIRGDSINCGSSAGIYLYNCHDIHITKCKFVNGTTSAGVGIYLLGGYNITIDSCFFSGTASGLYAQLCTGGIAFNLNHALNMQGPLPRGQMVQFSSCSGAGNQVLNNISQGLPGANGYEDHINVYSSSGTSSSPILIEYNEIYGRSSSTTGSGITVADGTSGNYITVMYNTVVNCGSHGIQSAGGTYVNISNNTIYSKQTTTSLLGLGYANYTGVASNNVTMGFNQIKWINNSGAEADTLHHYQAGSTQVSTPAAWSTNYVNSAIDSTVLSFPLWASCSLAPAIAYAVSNYSYYAGHAITLTPSNTGGSVTSWSISPSVPSGLSFSTSTGIISGTSTAAHALTSYTVTATNSSGNSTYTLNLRGYPSSQLILYGGGLLH